MIYIIAIFILLVYLMIKQRNEGRDDDNEIAQRIGKFIDVVNDIKEEEM